MAHCPKDSLPPLSLLCWAVDRPRKKNSYSGGPKPFYGFKFMDIGVCPNSHLNTIRRLFFGKLVVFREKEAQKNQENQGGGELPSSVPRNIVRKPEKEADCSFPPFYPWTCKGSTRLFFLRFSPFL